MADPTQLQAPADRSSPVSQAAHNQPVLQDVKLKEEEDKFAAGRKGGLEAEPVSEAGSSEARSGVVAEVPAVPELEKKPELAGFVDRVDVDLDVPVVYDYTGQILLKPSQNQSATVTLPLTEEQVREGLHHRVFDAIRWLAEWCVRQIKILHGRVRYKPSETEAQRT